MAANSYHQLRHLRTSTILLDAINYIRSNMTTRTDMETVELILDEKEYARKHRINYIKHLSCGKRMCKGALNTIVSVGALQIVLSVLGIVWGAIELYLLYVGPNASSLDITDKALLYHATSIVAYIVTLGLGIKLYSLSATPAFILGALLFVIPVNVAIMILVNGLIPQILATLIVIFSVIGLTKWNAYNYWFSNIDPKKFRNKKETQ